MDAPARGTTPAPLTLYSYYRSSCSWRVRLALELKGLAYELQCINLLKGEQDAPAYRALNASGAVPALQTSNGHVLAQSAAILEYLEEAYGECGMVLLPVGDALLRAKVRELVQIVVADCQPLQNLRVLRCLSATVPVGGEAAAQDWARTFIARGLRAFEAALPGDREGFCVGATVTLADVVLLPQLYNARRFGIDVEGEFAGLWHVEQHVHATHGAACARAHPDQQPDRPGA